MNGWGAAVGPIALGGAWAVVAGAGAGYGLVGRRVAARARRLATRPAAGSRRRITAAIPSGPAPIRHVVARWRRERTVRRTRAGITRALPGTVDLLAVGVTAGLTPYLALEAAIGAVPPTMAIHLEVVRARVHTGTRFADALDALARDQPVLAGITGALLASERLGAPVAPALLRVASEARAAARRRAEEHARKVPVRLLFPLVFLVLPAFVLLTVVPAVASGFAR